MDQRPGGTSHIIMCRPGGEGSDGEGVFLEAVPQQQLVLTIAFTTAWNPFHQLAAVPFMVTVIEVSDEGGKTRYVVRPLHWTEEALKQHEEMGFLDGWKQTAGQLENLARTL